MADERDLEGDEEETESGGGSRKKLLLLISIAVLLLAISGAAAFLLTGDDEPDADGAPADEAAAEQAPAERPTPLYHAFSPEFVVNLQPGGRANMMQLSLQAMTHQQEVVAYLEQNDPMLRHHLFNLFSAQKADALFSRKGREALAKSATDLLNDKLQESGLEGDVQAVYFTELVLQ
jgi:flagellar FliL protein